MDYAVQPLIFCAADEAEEPRRAEFVMECLRAARLWYWVQMGGQTFDIAGPATLRSEYTRQGLIDQHLWNGAVHDLSVWSSCVRDGIARGQIEESCGRVYYFICSLPGIGAKAAKRDFFGIGAILSSRCTRMLSGPDPRRHDLLRVAGEMAHELGHALTFSDDGTLENTRRRLNVMGYDAAGFPDCTFDREQREAIWRSPFIAPRSRPDSALLADWERPPSPAGKSSPDTV